MFDVVFSASFSISHTAYCGLMRTTKYWMWKFAACVKMKLRTVYLPMLYDVVSAFCVQCTPEMPFTGKHEPVTNCGFFFHCFERVSKGYIKCTYNTKKINSSRGKLTAFFNCEASNIICFTIPTPNISHLIYVFP